MISKQLKLRQILNSLQLVVIYFPESLNYLDRRWIYNLDKLNTITVSPENKYFISQDEKILIGKSCGYKGDFNIIQFASRQIDRVTIPKNIRIVGFSSFFCCKNLETVDFSQNSILIKISDRSFRDCKSLKSVKLPSSVQIIGFECFMGCSSLSSITFGENSQLATIGSNAFFGCAFTSFEIQENVALLDADVFSFCKKLSKIIFPQKSQMTKLPGNAFLNENFSSIIIPKYINKIGFCGLGQCNNLLTVEFLGDEMNLGCNFFRDSEKLIIVSFPNAEKVNFGATPFINGSRNASIFIKAKAKLEIETRKKRPYYY